MEANEVFDTMMRELNSDIISDADGGEEQESFSFHEETQDSGDIPPSLLSYFEASKSRAAICEKLILEDLEASPPSHHTEDMMNFPSELDEDVMPLSEQVVCDEENDTVPDPHLRPAATETEALFTDVVSLSPNNEDEYVDIEKQLALEYEAEREKRHREEMKKEEQRRQRERDFQEELQKIMEAEKLHQKELALMGKRAQERLEQELLLQQEVISNLQRRVEEERKMREEEQKRIKDEQDKRRREEEKLKMEAERTRMERERIMEEMKLKKEEEQRKEKRKREEEKLKMEAERKRMEEEMRRKEEERKIEEMKLKKEEEEKRRVEREEKKRREEETKKMEAERKRMEEERKIEVMQRKNEKEKKLREEEQERMKDEEDKTRREEEKLKIGAERKRMEEERKIEEIKRKNEEEEKKKQDHEIRMMKEEEERNKKEEVERTERGEEEKQKKEEEKNKMKEARKMEREKRKLEEEMSLKKKKEEGDLKIEEETLKRTHEEMRKGDERGDGGVDREISLEERWKMEEEKKEVKEEFRKREEAEKELEEGKVKESKKEVNKKTEEGGRLREEESKKGVEQEQEVKVEDELQERREENGLMGENETKNKDETSQRGDGTSWTSSSSGASHSEPTTSPTSTETRPPHCDPEENASQASTDHLPVCLPEHTERKRLSWMRDCVPWSKLSLRNRRKQKGSARSRRGLRGGAEVSLPPLCPDSLLQAAGSTSLQEVTTVTLEDLPGCNLSTLAQCAQLRSLTLRRCGLRSLDGIKHLAQLCYINVQENDISFVDCENMSSLRVLRLSHNKLTSIHGLTGAENLDVLDLTHNSITRIAGLESVKRLQRLSVGHNQLISTKGLRDVYTLLHLNVSHNHLAGVEGLENSALLHTLDLRGNSLTEPPTLNNQVLLRELHLDDNSISSLQGLSACWLPLMQRLSVAQNRITQLPSMSDSLSLAKLDLRSNCVSEIQSVCESLEGCQFLQEVHLTGNPLQQETSWRSALQRAVSGLRLIDDQETDSVLTPPAVQRVSSASGSFLVFCQAQLQQTQDLQQRHSRELSDASSSLDALRTSCRHFTEALQLAEDQRFAHEYGDTTVTDKHRATGQTAPEDTPDVDHNSTEKSAELPVMESTGNVPQVVPHRDGRSYRSSEEKSAAESQHDRFHTVTAGPETELTVSAANSVSVRSSATRGKTSSSSLDMAPVSNHQTHSTAAVVIQQLWRKYRQKCGNSSSSSTAEKGGGRGGDGGKPESGPSYINGSVVGKDYAATVIQAFWRGFTLRRRLASALAAVTCPDSGEDDTLEEVDVDEFVFDEAALQKQWMLSISEDSPPRRFPVSEQQLSVKPPVPFPEPSPYILPPPAVQRPKQAWVSGEQVDSAGRRVSPESSNRSKSPASASVLSGLSERSEKILEEWGFTDSNTALLMLKRAQKMKPTKQKRRRDPSVRLAMFRNCSYQLAPVEARNRPTQHNRRDIKVGEAEPGLQQAERVERVKQERAQQWLQTQAAHSDRDSESVHFLPEISSDVLNGGRVQLVADPGYTERRHHARGLRANNSLAAQPRRENSYPRRNSVGRARTEVPSPQRVTSAPSRKERISFRDKPVELSGGWGGGKKRDTVYK